MPADDSWTVYQREVLSALERHEKKIDRQGEKIDEAIEKIASLEKQHAILQIKSGLWGMVAGATLPGIYLLYELIKGK